MAAFDEDDAGAPSGIAGRISGLFGLLTSLDRRLIAALDVFEQMQKTLSAFDDIAQDSEGIADDVRSRIARMDDRVHRELDDVKHRADDITGDLRDRLYALDERVHRELDRVREQSDSLVADFRDRLTDMDARMNRELDDLRLLADRGTGIVKVIEERIDSLDRRVHRDLDDFKEQLEAKLSDFDLLTFVTRFDRLEQAVLNIEEATVNLDRAVEGTVGSLPDFVQRRVREEGRKLAPPGARDVPPQ